MIDKKPALASTRIKRVGLLLGFSLIATLSAHADLDGVNELRVTDADPGASIETVDGTGLHNVEPAPPGLLTVDGTGVANRVAVPAEGTETQPVRAFADFSALDNAQAIGCESVDGEASDICVAAESVLGE